MAAKIIKEIIIMLLVALATMLVLAVSFYQYAPSKKIVPEISNYKASEDVQDLLEDDIDSRDRSKDNVILTYEVTSSDLNNYQSTKEYVPGKANPFSAYVETITEEEKEETPGEDENDPGEGAEKQKNETKKESTSNEYFKNTGTK